VTAPSRRLAAVGCRAHTGWAALVVVSGGSDDLDVLARRRIELVDSDDDVPRAVYQRSRGLRPAGAARRIAAVEQLATKRAAEALEGVVRDARDTGASVQRCAVVVGSNSADTPLESILASHALAHAAEGRLYQEALLDGAEAAGLEAISVARVSLWDEACWALDVSLDELKRQLADVRPRIGPPWAEDQKLAALAARIALVGVA
jgi:hypothetical protein